MHVASLQRRHNIYDGAEEFWVVTRESGKRSEQQSLEEIHTKQQKACYPYVFHAQFIDTYPRLYL